MVNNLFFINPIGDHKVFKGRHKFFKIFFNYRVLCEYEGYDKIYTSIGKSFLIKRKTNFVRIYKNRRKFNKEDILLIGDIFTNTLCYTIKKGRRLYYSEFFLDGKPFIIKLIFYIIGFTFFHNKKIILPHILGYNTFKKISKNCLYLPILYDGDICYSKKNTYDIINLLFVGRIDYPAKNIDFLIENYLELSENYKNLNLTLVGKICNREFYKRHENSIKSGKIKHIERVSNINELGEIYAHNDIFILPSLKEPIGAVIQESMAHGCAVLVSDKCGGGCYLEKGKNGFVFKVNDSEDFRNKLELLLNDIEKLKSFKKRSAELIKEKYDINNDKLMKQYFYELNKFIFS